MEKSKFLLSIISFVAMTATPLAYGNDIDFELLDEIKVIEKEQMAEHRRDIRAERAKRARAKKKALRKQLAQERAKRKKRAQQQELESQKIERKRKRQALIQAHQERQHQRNVRKKKMRIQSQRYNNYNNYNNYKDDETENSTNQLKKDFQNPVSDSAHRDFQPKAGSNQIKTSMDQKQNFWNRSKRYGWNIYSYYSAVGNLQSSANSYEYDNGFIDSSDLPDGIVSGSFVTRPAFGIGSEYARPQVLSAGPVRFGIAAGCAYEFDRYIDREYRDSFGSEYGNSPKLALILPYINTSVGFKDLYAFAGLNYSFPRMEEAADEIYTGEMGYQVGFGYNVLKWLSAELSHRWVSFKATPKITEDSTTYDVASIDRSGLGILREETLKLNGFLLNLKLRF